MKMRIRNSFGGSRTRKRQLSDAAQAHVASLDGRTARNLQGAQYEMDYAYNASSALHFVDAANITWVTTEVVGSIAPSGVPTADPTATPTTATPTPAATATATRNHRHTRPRPPPPPAPAAAAAAAAHALASGDHGERPALRLGAGRAQTVWRLTELAGAQ